MFSDTTCLTYQVSSPPSIPSHTRASIKGFVEGWGLSRRGSWKPQHCKLGLRSKMRKVGTPLDGGNGKLQSSETGEEPKPGRYS